MEQTQIQKILMEEMGLSNLPQDKQEELFVKMTEILLKRIFLETIEKLNPAEQESFGEMLDRGAPAEEVESFLKLKIADYDVLMRKIVSDFKREMKEDAANSNQN